jgi:hypothetical protein
MGNRRPDARLTSSSRSRGRAGRQPQRQQSGDDRNLTSDQQAGHPDAKQVIK